MPSPTVIFDVQLTLKPYPRIVRTTYGFVDLAQTLAGMKPGMQLAVRAAPSAAREMEKSIERAAKKSSVTVQMAYDPAVPGFVVKRR